jgi:hypothetical protein
MITYTNKATGWPVITLEPHPRVSGHWRLNRHSNGKFKSAEMCRNRASAEAYAESLIYTFWGYKADQITRTEN